MNLLYIDDNELDHFILEKIQNKYQVFKSVKYIKSGKEAIDFLETNIYKPDKLPDIIFLDLYMDHFSGWDFLDEYKKIYPVFGKNISLHILSHSFLSKDVSRSKKYPCVSAYYVKPMTKDMLLGQI